MWMGSRDQHAAPDPGEGFEDYREERDAARVEAEVETRYSDVVSATPERFRDWIRAVAFEIESGDVEPAPRRTDLARFLERIRRHKRNWKGDAISAAMSLLDDQDWEKRHWEDESGCLFAALDSLNGDIVAVLTAALAGEDEYVRRMAAKWLPKYTADAFAAPILAELLLSDPEPRVRWWAAVHLSRLAPATPGLTAVLVEALHGDRISCARLLWCFGLSGKGEAAAALARLGPVEAGYLSYDQQWIGCAIRRIEGDREALELLGARLELKFVSYFL